MHTYFENARIVFLYIMQDLDTSGTSYIISRTKELAKACVQYLPVHTRNVPVLLAR